MDCQGRTIAFVAHTDKPCNLSESKCSNTFHLLLPDTSAPLVPCCTTSTLVRLTWTAGHSLMNLDTLCCTQRDTLKISESYDNTLHIPLTIKLSMAVHVQQTQYNVVLDILQQFSLESLYQQERKKNMKGEWRWKWKRKSKQKQRK